MYDQLREETLYIILYAAVTMLSLMACCYLLFRRGNAFAPDITPPARLRRWTAVFFAFIALSHMWYPEKESERKIVDWDRTYFLAKYYGF